MGTDPLLEDTDGDGLPDDLELGLGEDAHPNSRTDPGKPDTDLDGLPDGLEDANKNGDYDSGETHPRRPDTDGDDLLDGEEDADADGVFEPEDGETDPLDRDSDDGGVHDGDEVLRDGTDPLDPSDDKNTVDAGETNEETLVNPEEVPSETLERGTCSCTSSTPSRGALWFVTCWVALLTRRPRRRAAG